MAIRPSPVQIWKPSPQQVRQLRRGRQQRHLHRHKHLRDCRRIAGLRILQRNQCLSQSIRRQTHPAIAKFDRGIGSLQLLDAQGRLVRRMSVETQVTEISLIELASGVYMMRLLGDGRQVALRVVKE